MSNVLSIYGGKEPRELPFYTRTDVANYLHIPRSTLDAWCGRKSYKLAGGDRKNMAPLLRLDPKTRRLTFLNLVEAYVVSSLTRTFAIPLPLLRTALTEAGGERPLLDNIFYARKGEMFVELADKVLVQLHRSPGQVVLRGVVESSIERIEFDTKKRPARFHPWRESITERRVVSIDPRRAFGRPTVVDSGLKVEVIVDLRRAGESVESIARNYDVAEDVVRDVLKWGERGAKVAA
jgi:uncharacterized protein (DUF433 family)